jgi:acetylornithine/succinyldiaminopimelate/putrescine aminotransferase
LAKAEFWSARSGSLKSAARSPTSSKVALIFDEIQCGLGRTGNLFAFQTFGVKPTSSRSQKPIAAGLPLGAFLAREDCLSHLGRGRMARPSAEGRSRAASPLNTLRLSKKKNCWRTSPKSVPIFNMNCSNWWTDTLPRKKSAVADSFRASI